MNDMSWISLGMAALATLTSIASAVVAAWVKVAQIRAESEARVLRETANRLAAEKSTQDAEIAALKAQNAHQAEQIAVLAEKHAECERQFAEIRMAVGIVSPHGAAFPDRPNRPLAP
jgi:uncharacterized protein YlxW (UPF0749 family)